MAAVAVHKRVLWTVAAVVGTPRAAAVNGSAAERLPEALVPVAGAAAPLEATRPLAAAPWEAAVPEPAAHAALQAWEASAAAEEEAAAE